MISVDKILDAHARDKQLRAFAYLQARFTTGAQNAIECLFPFFVSAIAAYAGEQLDQDQLLDYIRDNFGLSIPFYMMDDIIPKLIEFGAISEDNLVRVRICRDVTDREDAKEKGLDFTLEDIALVEAGLSAFAATKGLNKPMSRDSWGDVLIQFFQSESTEQKPVTSKVKDVLLHDVTNIENSIIASYIISCSRNEPNIYALVEKIFYGVLVGDFLTNIQSVGNKSAYKGLSVFFDATVLMRLLGTSGRQLQLATQELHETLAHLGCRQYYFAHTYDELQNNIEAVIQAKKHGGTIHSETQAAFQSGEISLGQLSLIRTEADFTLAGLGITQHDASYTGTRKQDEFQIEEAEFAGILGSHRRTRKGQETWQKDASSLALILRLRAGATSRDVSKCVALFVTSNRYLASAARRYVINQRLQSERDIAPMLTVGQMTTVGWLADEVLYQPDLVSKELVANCYRASVPTAGWDEAFWKALGEVSPLDVKARLENAIFIEGARRIALETSYGQAALVPKLDMASIMSAAQNAATKLTNAAREEGEKNGRRYSQTMMEKNGKNAIAGFVHKVFRLATWIIFIVSLVAAVLSLLPADIVPIGINWLGKVVSFIVSVLSLLELLKITPIYRAVGWMENWVVRRLFDRLYRLSGE